MPLSRRQYLRLRTRLNLVELDAARSFDRAITTLSGGALFLTVAYRKEIAPGLGVGSKWCLVAAWVGFALALCISAFSHLATQAAARDRRKELGHSHNPEHDPGVDTPNISNWPLHDRLLARLFSASRDPGDMVDRLNLRAAFFFSVGVTSLLICAALNVNGSEEVMSDRNTKEQRGGAPDVEKRGYRPEEKPVPPPAKPSSAKPPDGGKK